MRINEVEALAGITKKNIRFYEEQGLLSPRRSAENGYRDYGEEEVLALKRIRLLRKLGVPIEDIRKMFAGSLTLSDGMRRHLITLEREQRNLEQSTAMCCQLRDLDIPLGQLDTQQILARMEELEKGGATFPNTQAQDVRVRYVAPVVVTVLVVGLLLALGMLMIWAWLEMPEESPPLWFLAVCVGLCAATGAGVILALIQRIKEIGKGEIDDAKRY